MDRDQDFVSLAVYPHRVVVVLVGLITCRRKLDVDVLGHTSRQHSLLVTLDLEVGRLRRQYVQALRRWAVIDQPHFQRVSTVRLEASEFHY